MFDPKVHLIQLVRKVKNKDTGGWDTRYDDYLEVKWRVLMFRETYPHGVITTEEVCVDLDRGYARYKATVEDGEGGVATGYGTETQADFTDYAERAETRAVGRALALAGFGTAFAAQDLAEMPHVADAPVAQANGQGVEPMRQPVAQPVNGQGPLTADEVNALLQLARSVGVDLQAFGHDMRQLLGLVKGTKISKKLLRTSMHRPQYETAWQAYSDRLKQQVEQGLAEPEDVPDHAPPAATTTNGSDPFSAVAVVAMKATDVADQSPEERMRWGALSRRSMKAGLSPSDWTTLREVGDYAAAERVIGALEQATPTTGEG